MLRHIEVSHWGNIAIEETIDVYHNGAKLKGSFSRFEYQREQSGVSSVKSFKVNINYKLDLTHLLTAFLFRRCCLSRLATYTIVMRLETSPLLIWGKVTITLNLNCVLVSLSLADGSRIMLLATISPAMNTFSIQVICLS